MNSNFEAYGEYYDLIYTDKDYVSEAHYVERLIGRAAPKSMDILDLGCGTGIHARCLAERGFKVLGVEISDEMFSKAKKRQIDASGCFAVERGDARTFRSNLRFDVVISLFHVVSYLISPEDLDCFFKTAAHHLREDGCLIFDVWYGPAVLNQKPESRVKRLENEKIRVVRSAEPEMNCQKNMVTVKYKIDVVDKFSSSTVYISESHNMRYYFEDELKSAAALNGMEFIFAEEWMTGRVPSANTWGVVFVFVRRGAGVCETSLKESS